LKILLAVDGSAYTKKMLAYLVTHDEVFTALHNEFTLLTVRLPIAAARPCGNRQGNRGRVPRTRGGAGAGARLQVSVAPWH